MPIVEVEAAEGMGSHELLFTLFVGVLWVVAMARMFLWVRPRWRGIDRDVLELLGGAQRLCLSDLVRNAAKLDRMELIALCIRTREVAQRSELSHMVRSAHLRRVGGQGP